MFITIAFNQPELIRIQLEALATFVQDTYEVLVVDNSSDLAHQAEIQRICEAEGGHYVLSPKNPYSWIDPSLSHSLVMTWAWRNLVLPKKPEVAVFLDHDLFPVEPVSIRGSIDDFAVAGVKKESSRFWYLWPGLLFLRVSAAASHRLSFLPGGDADSGGGLYRSLYSRLRQDKVRFLPLETRSFSLGDEPEWRGQVQIINGSWLHLIDGSGWSDGVGKLAHLPIPEVSLTSLGIFLSELPTNNGD